jgi:transcriptional regulator with XRE-family HTH domain
MQFDFDGVGFHGEFAEAASQITPEEWSYYDLADSISDQIYNYMEANNISKSELAKKMGTSRPFVTKILSGDMNVTLKTLAKILNGLGAKAEVKIAEKDQNISWFGIVKGLSESHKRVPPMEALGGGVVSRASSSLQLSSLDAESKAA